MQMTLPWASTIDVSYVGQHGFNQLREIRGQNQVDINAVDFEAAFLPQNQDPTLAPSPTPGANAYSTDLLRPYRGLGQVGFNFPDFHETYHSIQTSLNRRFRDGVAFGLDVHAGSRLGTATSASFSGCSTMPTAPMSSEPIRPIMKRLNKDMGNRRHLLKANFLWDLPNLRSTNQTMRALGLLVNDWQLSGILTAGSGAPYDISYSYQNGGSSVNLTGSPSYPAMIRIVGDTGKGLLRQSVRAVRRRGVRRAADRQPRPGVGPQLHGGLSGSHARPLDRPEHPARGSPTDSAAPRRVQRAEHRRL